jgi:hypothetical protein
MKINLHRELIRDPEWRFLVEMICLLVILALVPLMLAGIFASPGCATGPIIPQQVSAKVVALGDDGKPDAGLHAGAGGNGLIVDETDHRFWLMNYPLYAATLPPSCLVANITDGWTPLAGNLYALSPRAQLAYSWIHAEATGNLTLHPGAP